MKKLLLLLLGHLFLVLGIIGAFLPILPTTPFLLLSAFFYSKGSEKFHVWLLNHKYLGPPVRDWQQEGVVGMKAKILATIMILLAVCWRIPLLKIAFAIKVVAITVLISVLIFLWTRPSKRRQENLKP